MTEYDFSEEAYTRYMETQSRISRWTQSTSLTPQKDPFAPPTPAIAHAALPNPSPKKSSSSKRRTKSSDRDGGYDGRRGSRDGGREKERRSPPQPTPVTLERSRSSGAQVIRPRTAPPVAPVPGPSYAQAPGMAPQPGYAPHPMLVQGSPPHSFYPTPAGYYPAPQPQEHRRARSTSTGPQNPHTHVRSGSFSTPQPMRSATYPYAAPPGQPWVSAPYPAYPTPPPGPSSSGVWTAQPYSSAPQLVPGVHPQMHPHGHAYPGMAHPQPVYGYGPGVAAPAPIPSKEPSLLRRIFGFNGGERERERESEDENMKRRWRSGKAKRGNTY